ncbi:hypothetical protein AnigIFM63604_010809 [Aspergillus niger]|uniref:Uncharacterized protein n=1 Tax=Aspergillus niger TaxID=5061 RepID=A0A9W6EC42_ASPNG|nr:hypothetical protein AlacWU_03287 [Aspergillus niger]GKZ90003.1 hypothetical protein AnigIFM59636_001496 [Aspergillus niger]GLA26536.1 hypothetical protein AnigIFM63326_003699 [Aspergillus niger]GLA53514.1 hypothetical protein AnigIFM63604_010809 [Aspergillus niger]
MVKDDASIINNDPTCHIISKQVTPFLRIIPCPQYGFRLDQAEVGCRPIWRVASHELLPGRRNPDWQQQGRSGASNSQDYTVTEYHTDFTNMFGNLLPRFLELCPATNASQANAVVNEYFRDLSRTGTWDWA